jgi:ABC-type uncharacterized transport system substrate-binding protein
MNKKIVAFVLVAATFVYPHLAYAQEPKKVPRIGFLSATGPQPRNEAFREGLRELGYVEGQNIVIEWRFAEGKPDRISHNAAVLVGLKVDIIVTTGPTDTRAAKAATASIPIVMAQDSDPVGNGFVASLARPGGNITGLSNLSSEISGKRLELLKEIIPKLSRVAALGTSTEPGNAQGLRDTELAADALGVQLQSLDVSGPKDVETAFRAASKERAQAVLVLASAVLTAHRAQIIELAVKSRLPAIYNRGDYAEEGGAYELRREACRLVPPRRYICGQDLEGRKAGRSSRRAAHEVRAGDQFENGEADRFDDPAKRAGESGQSHKMTFSILVDFRHRRLSLRLSRF